MTARRVLVAVASKHGATRELGAEIVLVLKESGLDVTFADPDEVKSLRGWDAVVLGSAVYVARWLNSARKLVAKHAADLDGTPVWLFSSGPIGDPPRPVEEPADVAKLVRATNALEHRVFPGLVDKSNLAFAERAVVRVVGAAEGDYRDIPAVREWATQIAQTLKESP